MNIKYAVGLALIASLFLLVLLGKWDAASGWGRSGLSHDCPGTVTFAFHGRSERWSYKDSRSSPARL